MLRAHLHYEIPRMYRALGTAESAVRVLGRVRQHPEWLAGAAGALLLLRPSRMSGWARGITHGMRTWRRLLPLFMSLRR